MGIYAKYILPKLIDRACSIGPIMRQRAKVVPLASGEVLEIGIGSGLNLSFYDPKRVRKVWGLDPNPEVTRIARERARALDLDTEIIGLPGEEIPLGDHSVDSIVITYTLCTIPDPAAALVQMRRVLRQDGKLFFCEHGAAPDPSVRRWQDRVDPIWRRIAGGCHLNRDVPRLLEAGGFRIDQIETMYLPGWRPASFNSWGTATARG